MFSGSSFGEYSEVFVGNTLRGFLRGILWEVFWGSKEFSGFLLKVVRMPNGYMGIAIAPSLVTLI